MSAIGGNKIVLIGYVGQDPKRRQASAGKGVTNFSFTVGEPWKHGNGKKAEWFRCVCWNGLSDIAADYVGKDRLYIEGRLKSRTWVDKKGEKHVSIEVVVSSLGILEPVDKERTAQRQGAPETRQRRAGLENRKRRRGSSGAIRG